MKLRMRPDACRAHAPRAWTKAHGDGEPQGVTDTAITAVAVVILADERPDEPRECRSLSISRLRDRDRESAEPVRKPTDANPVVHVLAD